MSQLAERAASAIIRRHKPALSRNLGTDAYGQWALGAISTVMVCQLLFLLVGCDWDFSGDEAEYWAWSRHLDWSYYSRGPLIAWLIRLATVALAG